MIDLWQEMKTVCDKDTSLSRKAILQHVLEDSLSYVRIQGREWILEDFVSRGFRTK